MAFVRNGSLAVFFEKDFAVNSVAFGVLPLPPLKPLLPLKPPYHASEVGREVEAVARRQLTVGSRVARRGRARSGSGSAPAVGIN